MLEGNNINSCFFQRCWWLIIVKSLTDGNDNNFRGAGGDDNKNRKPLAVLRLSSVDTAADDVDMNVEPASKREDQVSQKDS